MLQLMYMIKKDQNNIRSQGKISNRLSVRFFCPFITRVFVWLCMTPHKETKNTFNACLTHMHTKYAMFRCAINIYCNLNTFRGFPLPRPANPVTKAGDRVCISLFDRGSIKVSYSTSLDNMHDDKWSSGSPQKAGAVGIFSAGCWKRAKETVAQSS